MAGIPYMEFGIRQSIRQGAGCVSALPEIIAREGWKKIMLVCGPSLHKSGASKPVEDGIKSAGAEYIVFTNIRPNPEAATIEREAIPAALNFGAEAIVALGGGSTLDSAKGVAIVGNSGKRVMDFTIERIRFNPKFEHKTLPLVAIPSTAGTGSEVCKNAVICDDAGLKLVLAHEAIVPKYALLDPDFLKSLPFSVAVATAMDTFVQALETLTNRRANDFTRTQSLRSLELVGQYIRPFTANPADTEAANGMSLACMYAGFSLGLAGIGQDHVITHPMSEAPFYIAHGDACGMVLPALIEYNGLSCKELYRQAYNALTAKNVPPQDFELQALIDWVMELNVDLRVAGNKSFAEWGFNDETLELMLKHPIVHFSALVNGKAEISEFPRMTSIEDFRHIIKRVAVYSEEQAVRARAKGLA